MELVSCTPEDEEDDHHQQSPSRQAPMPRGSLSATRVGSNISTWLQRRLTGACGRVVSLIACVLCDALRLLFGIVGACVGAMIGALAGWASGHGILYGAGVGAVAGAVISKEILEPIDACWCWDHTASHSSSSMADFIHKLLRNRFVNEQFRPATLIRASRLQNIHGGVASTALSGDSLKRLPCHMQLDECAGAQSICCTICLQDIGIWEIVRRLPRCHHTFHLTCVDKWLRRHDSCPVCRQDV